MPIKTLIIIALQLYTSALYACTCAGESTIEGGLQGADMVASAIVISQTLTADLSNYAILEGDTNNYRYKTYKYPSRVVTLKVLRLFKGRMTSDTLTIITPALSSGCGYKFENGKQYIVYANAYDNVMPSKYLTRRSVNSNVYWTHKCSRTGWWNLEEEVTLAVLTRK